ncbi:hypothetical protein [Winogradskyella sp. SYSU M77433]|uniref:hypothetical protein n=1 Tax=Winogradskyella sp. SYSU M77433 TaxID=3042722 RepID=UPI0024816C17|nr:hypothetical protein [Winogradskyella sp. SYSU M77433]MDH7913988.1 hypothetical protein [Winogradskyella sp. SYSU M77433]
MKETLLKTVLVFKTSIYNTDEVQKLNPLLNKLVAKNDRWNFDLEDCDNILRVESNTITAESVLGLLGMHGFYCEELH